MSSFDRTQAAQDWRVIVARITEAVSWRDVLEQMAPQLQPKLDEMRALLTSAIAGLPPYLEVLS